MQKPEIRKMIQARKKSLTAETRESASRAVFARLEQSRKFVEAQRILAYNALPDELPTMPFLLKWHAEGKNVFLPRVNGELLDILPFDPDHLEEGAFHIMEPACGKKADISDIDLVIVPAVAFDRQCNRLGRGKGFYDRLLKDATCPKIGVIFDLQLVDSIPTGPLDIPVDMVISESAVIRPERNTTL